MQIPLFEANQIYEEHHYGKVDICFYNSLKRLQKTYRLFKQFSIVRACLIVMVLLSHFQDDETKNIYPQTYKLVTLLLYILLIFNLGGWKLSSWTLENYFLDNNVMYKIASKIGHSEESQLLNDQFIYNENHHIFDTIPLKVSSTVYQYKLNMLSTDIDDVYRQFSQKQCTSLICEQIKRDTYINFWQNVLNLFSLAIFVISYIVLQKDTGVGSLEHTLILVHLLSQIYIRSTVYLIVLIVVLSPLFCLWLCIYSTFFKKKGIVVLPPVEQATTQMIIQCQGKCPICYQNIIQKQKVIVLKCSPKHVFHEICIQGWTKVKANCPICRTQLEMI